MTPTLALSGLSAGEERSAGAGTLELRVEIGAMVVLETTQRLADWTIRACAGLERPAGGTVTVCGLELARLGRAQLNRLRSRLGVALQPGGLISNQTLRMNLVVPLLFGGGVPRADAVRRSEEMLDRCGLAGWADCRPIEVAPDLRQVAVVARALIRRPDLLLLEDPFAAVSTEQAQRLLALARELTGSILLATHRSDPVINAAADQVVAW